jgi:hypothetical protein
MLHAGKVTGTGEQELKKHLTSHLSQGFCPTRCSVNKANSRSSHPNVIAHTSATNAGNKRSFSVMKVEDAISTRQKRQCDMGRYEGMKYFDKEMKIKKLTW